MAMAAETPAQASAVKTRATQNPTQRSKTAAISGQQEQPRPEVESPGPGMLLGGKEGLWMAMMQRAFMYTPLGRYLAARYTGSSEACQSLAMNMMSSPYLLASPQSATTHRGATTITRWPRSARAKGSEPSTSARPPVLDQGATCGRQARARTSEVTKLMLRSSVARFRPGRSTWTAPAVPWTFSSEPLMIFGPTRQSSAPAAAAVVEQQAPSAASVSGLLQLLGAVTWRVGVQSAPVASPPAIT
ncbi:hypothetical protein TSOC_011678 [Tetrabaena socialis]|uniref:Uncharacterized protein n=1 Tax=Tetrabaena socialis TaxID=47790 RepID=A0A2J7ZQ13_9CHLO|nr:hypothetical protein TSOC_011678 [Tetrabaena socialis]|eukprot:PNH02353.1 hypothetical protein TSOC_011678 [Tetrabaena socialis]